MGKMLKALVVFLFAVAIVGCSTNSDAQREVVEQYFSFLEEGDAKQLESLMNRKADDDFGALEFMSFIEEIRDIEEPFGKDFLDEFYDFLDDVYVSIIEEYEIEEITVDGDETTVEVKGKLLRFENFNPDDTDLFYEAIADMADDILEMEDEDEYLEAIYGIYDDLAEEIFDGWRDELENLGNRRFSATFTLVKNDGEWLIDNISSKQSLTNVINDDALGDLDIGFDNSILYEIDQDKLLPENTILGKGRLVDSWENQKNIDTSFEFIDYNVINGNNEEIDSYQDVDLSSGNVTLDVEVAGTVGETFILSVEDSESNISIVERFTLTEEQMVFTVEISEFDIEASYLYVQLLLEEDYNERFNFGDKFGSIFIWNL